MNTLQQETHTISAGNPPTGTYFEEPQLSSGQIKCSCADFKKSQWCKHMPPGAVKTGWNEPQLSAEIQKRITEIIDEYVISHKGNAQCRCIEGARGHLRAKLFGLFDTFSQKHKGAAKIVVCPKCNYPEESCKCVTPEAIATALEEQKKDIIQEIVDNYGDYRFVVKKRFGYEVGRTLRFFLLPHTQHKKGDDENL